MRRFALLLALLFAATFAAGGAAAKPYEFYGCTFHDGKDMDDLDAWFGGWPHDRSREAWSKRRYPDDTWEIEYAYEGGAGEDPVYLQSGLTVEGSARDARFGYAALEAASRAGLSMFGGDELTIIERPDLLSWGDDSVCWLVEGPAGPVGAEPAEVGQAFQREVQLGRIAPASDIADAARESRLHVAGAEQVHDGGLRVGIGDYDPGLQPLAAGKLNPGDPQTVRQNALDTRAGAKLCAGRARRCR